MKFTPQRVKFLHSIDGVNYSLEFFFESMVSLRCFLLFVSCIRCLGFCYGLYDVFNR